MNYLDLVQLAQQERARLREFACEKLGIPAEVFAETGASRFEIVVLEYLAQEPESHAPDAVAEKLHGARNRFDQLCRSVPISPAPMACVEALSLAVGMLPGVENEEFVRAEPPANTVHLLMQIAMLRGMAVQALASADPSAASSPIDHVKVGLSALGRAAADARHAPNRARKAIWKAWYEANKGSFRSKDATADDLMEKAGVAWRTARDWIQEWDRELRSAGRP